MNDDFFKLHLYANPNVSDVTGIYFLILRLIFPLIGIG